jgi:rhamnogalacturonyl hydrolase YesR
MNRLIPFVFTLICTGFCHFAFGGDMEKREDKLAKLLPSILEKCESHYRVLENEAKKFCVGKKGERYYPHSWDKKSGRLVMRHISTWTSGHFPGSLWYLYEATGKEEWRNRATEWTAAQAPMSKFMGNHDIGFMMYCSVGNGLKLCKKNEKRYRDLLLRSAKTLCLRFNDDLGLIRSWGKLDDKNSFLVIPDNMMNLELLMWASKQGGKDATRFGRIAVSHADVSMKNHFRQDGGTYHVLNYDQKTGRVLDIRRGQGASCLTAWSRGQSWAIYGFTMMYRETGKKEYLQFAQKLSDYAIYHRSMPADGIPYWDYGAPGEERDTSAAAVMASGLLELSKYVSSDKGREYRAFAVKQLLSLASNEYFAAQGENGGFILKHGVGHKPGKSEIDVPLNYGDYYFLEALLRFKAMSKQK